MTMKTKLFMLLTMMFVSMGAFAQSSAIQGDVNNDGKVDVADIVKVIDIMQNSAPQPAVTYYWYVGTTKPTSLDQCEVISEYPAEQIFTNPSETTKCYVFTLTNSDKTVNFYDPADPNDALVKQEDTTTINGYKITYISDGTNPFKIAKGGSIIIRIS